MRRIRYFVEIADQGSMTRASESLRIAQPALSQQISNLESDLGTRLFDRSTQGVRLTQSGEVFYRYGVSLLRQLDEAFAAVKDQDGNPGGRVVLGVPGSTGKILAVPLLQSLLKYHRVKLEIVERPSGELLPLVANGKLDLAVVVDPGETRGTAVEPIVEEELLVFAKAGDVAEGRAVRLEDVGKRDLVLPSPPSSIRRRIDNLFLEMGLGYRLLAEISTTDMLMRIVANGLGWTILPWTAGGDYLARGEVTAFAIKGHSLKREIAICTSDVAPLSRAAEVVKEAVLLTLSDLVMSAGWKGASPVVRNLRATQKANLNE